MDDLNKANELLKQNISSLQATHAVKIVLKGRSRSEEEMERLRDEFDVYVHIEKTRKRAHRNNSIVRYFGQYEMMRVLS